MNQPKDQSLIAEFHQLADRLREPGKLKTVMNWASEAFSLKTTALLQALGSNRRLKQLDISPLILNIGCGTEPLSGCINADLAPALGSLWRIITRKGKRTAQYYLNILYRDHHLEGIADGIVFSHVLEHLSPHLSVAALRNCLYFLKPGGALRLSVPYLGHYNGDSIPLHQNLFSRILAQNKLIYGWAHRFMYDAELLLTLLAEAGFVRACQVKFGDGPLHECDISRRAAETIYVVGYKPPAP